MTKKPVRLPALVADPSSNMAALAAVMLRSLETRSVDATVDVSHTAAELARRPYCLVLIDEHLAGSGGFDMIRAVRRSADNPNRQTPIFMMASAPDAKMIAAARDAGITEFLRKPFSAEHIKLRLDGLTKAPRPFVEGAAYTGPDRRRRTVASGAARRAADKASG
jgi:two-component system, chemotaxis family, chemotaxis protein CheY